MKQGKGLAEIHAERGLEMPPELEAARRFFRSPIVTDQVELQWRAIDVEAVVGYLRDEHDFSEERVRKAAEEVAEAQAVRKGSLSKWF